jgi:hypothetical protein
MNSRKMLLRDIETLRESIKLNRAEIGKPELTQADRVAMITHGARCMEELAGLIGLLNSYEPSN